jgi:hypothetical protein
MVALWSGLDLPAWQAPYILRDARLGYLNGYEEALTSAGMPPAATERAAQARWGAEWSKRLEAARKRAR